MATVTVSSSSGLIGALKSAHAGDTILLAGGTYSSVAISNFHAVGTVNITSASATNPAVINALTVTNSSGLKFSNLTLATNLSSSPTSLSAAAPFQVNGSSNITFNAVNVHGSLDSNADNDVNGLLIQHSTNVSVTNSTFQQLFTAIDEVNNTNVVISNNAIHDIRVDGIDNAGSSNVVISGNQLANFFPEGDPTGTGDHADAIQFWTAGTTSDASNIVIANNTYVRGTGAPAQGIFVTDQIGLQYNNVTVTGNNIIGSLGNGIDVSSANNVSVSWNTVAGYSDLSNNIRLQNDSGVSLYNNVSSGYYFVANTLLNQLANQTIGTIAAVAPTLSTISSVAAVAETAVVNERQTVTGNALAGDKGTGLYLADVGIGSGYQKSLPAAGATLTGTYGNLTIHQDGSYSYVATKEGLTVGQTYDDHFTLTVASTGGGTQSSTLDIIIGGSGIGNGNVNTIVGGAGAETISGFGATSTLISGTGQDTFAFNSADSTPTAQTKVQGFKAGDIIDLTAVDPNFHVVTKFDHHADELLIMNEGGGSWEIYGDTTGSGTANFLIHVIGATTTLTAASFHL